MLASGFPELGIGFAPIGYWTGADPDPPDFYPVSNTSVNPARSTGVAFFAETAAVPQLWAFWLAPLIGAALGGIIYKLLWDKN